jgi:hypothetical protein
MRRVYQRHPELAPRLLLLLLLGACGGGSPQFADSGGATASQRSIDPALALATRSFALATHRASAGGELLATESSAAGRRAVWLSPLAPSRPRGLTPPERDCVALSALPAGASLVDCADATGSGRALRLLDAAGHGEPLTLPGDSARESLLAHSDRPPTLWSATAPVGETPARLLATGLAPLGRRTVFTAPPGFEIVAVAPDAARAILRRSLTPEADEVVLHDWKLRDSRLLLPTASDGRFTALRFVERGSALLLLADDGRDTPRLERFDLSSGRRTAWRAPPCPPSRLHAHADGTVTVEMTCEGRRQALRLDAAGAALPPPALPSGVRVVDTRPADSEGALALVTAGERWPAEVAFLDSRGDFRPLTYGLAPRLRSLALPAPRPQRVTSAGETLPAELWPVPGGVARAVAIWFEDHDSEPRFGELRPLPAALAAQGIAVLVVRGRGSEGASRRLRRAADGDPAGAALVDLRAAAAATAGLALPGAPRLLVGAGRWWGAAALVLAATADPRYAAVAALYPAPDPLAEAFDAASAEEPLRGFLLTRWGDPAVAGAAEQRATWSTAAERVRIPSWAALDGSRADTLEAQRRWSVAAASGVPLTVLTEPRAGDPARLPARLEEELLRFLAAQSNPEAR